MYHTHHSVHLAWSDVMSDQAKLWSDITNSWADILNVYIYSIHREQNPNAWLL